MQSMTFVVTHDDGRSDKIVCSAPDYVAFETHYDKPISVLETGRLTYLYWLAWHGLQRFKRTPLSFEDWVSSVTSVDIPDDDKVEISPLESPQPTG
jgi:hypothetical protein